MWMCVCTCHDSSVVRSQQYEVAVVRAHVRDVIALQLGAVDGSRQSPGAPRLAGEGLLDLA